jgi:hypothetical protein
MPDEPERWTEAVASYGPVFLLAAAALVLLSFAALALLTSF